MQYQLTLTTDQNSTLVLSNGEELAQGIRILKQAENLCVTGEKKYPSFVKTSIENDICLNGKPINQLEQAILFMEVGIEEFERLENLKNTQTGKSKKIHEQINISEKNNKILIILAIFFAVLILFSLLVSC